MIINLNLMRFALSFLFLLSSFTVMADNQKALQRIDALQQTIAAQARDIAQLNQSLHKIQAQHTGHHVAQKSQSTRLLPLHAYPHPVLGNSEKSFTLWHPNLAQGLVLFIAVALIWLILESGVESKPKPQPSVVFQTEAAEEGEYDFLNAQEGLDSCLDLARAYIEMGDYIEAQRAISKVLADGNESQQQEAERLIAQHQAQLNVL